MATQVNETPCWGLQIWACTGAAEGDARSLTNPASRVVRPKDCAACRPAEQHRRSIGIHLAMEGRCAPAMLLRRVRQPASTLGLMCLGPVIDQGGWWEIRMRRTAPGALTGRTMCNGQTGRLAITRMHGPACSNQRHC